MAFCISTGPAEADDVSRNQQRFHEMAAVVARDMVAECRWHVTRGEVAPVTCSVLEEQGSAYALMVLSTLARYGVDLEPVHRRAANLATE
jgi:hypothetical protein